MILKAKKIQIFSHEDTNETFSSKSVFELSQNLDTFYTFFEEIAIDELLFKEQNASLGYKNSEFYFNNEHFSLKLDLAREGKMLNSSIKELFIKDYNASARGQIFIDTSKDIYDFVGDFNSTHLSFDFKITYGKDSVNYDIKDLNLTSLSNAARLARSNFKFSNQVYEWLNYKIRADLFHFDTLKGKVKLLRKGYKIEDLSAKGYAKNLNLRLARGVEPIKVPYISVVLKNERIDFSFDRASFNGYDLSKSKLVATNVLDPKKGVLNVNLISNDLLFDEKAQFLLKSLKINVPLKQLSGKLQTNLDISIPLSPVKNTYQGSFEASNSQVDLANFWVQRGKIILSADKRLELKDFDVNNSFINAKFNANLDLNSKSGVFDTNITRLYFEDILDMRNENLRLDFSYLDAVILSSKDYDLSLDFSDGLKMSARDIKKFKDKSLLMKKLKISNAKSATLSTKDYVNFEILSKDTDFDVSLFKKDGKPYNHDDFSIKKGKNTFSLQSASKIVSIETQKGVHVVKAKDLRYIVPKDLNLSGSSGMDDFRLEALNSGIVAADKHFEFDSLHFTSLNKRLKAEAKRGPARYEFEQRPNFMSFKALNLNDKILNEIFAKNMVKNGNFNASIEGKDLRHFKGKIYLQDTYFKDLKFYNQLISFIDTIPSLLMFKSPTFNEQGLKVQKGAVLLERRGDILHLEGLDLDGDSVDILGAGKIDLNKSSIYLELELKTLKSASEVINKVPIINQILLGKDREISTRIVVEGDLNNPKFKTEVIADALKLPFNILKNIIEAPSVWFK